MNNENFQNIRGIKKHVEKSCRLLSEVIENGDGSRVKLAKAAFSLETARDGVQSVIMQIDEESANNDFHVLGVLPGGGTAGLIANNWLHLRLETNLPNNKNFAEVKRISKTITHLLNCYSESWGELPKYDRAFVAIVENIDPENPPTYDHDNKGYQAIPNALKGRMFDDDNQFTMSLGLFTVANPNDPHCSIYVIPTEDIAEFAAQYLTF
jgi:hypothetical protein